MDRAPRGASHDAQIILPASFAAASLIAQHVAGKATRDSLFLTRFGIAVLPAAMIGAALISSLAMVGTSRALARLGPARVVPAAFASSAALHAIEAAFASRFEGAVALAVYVHSAIFGSAAVSAFWSLMNESFDPHAAKRAVGRIAAGGTVGGVVGGLVVWQAAPLVPVQATLGLLALTNLVGLVGTIRVLSATARRGNAKPPATSTAANGESALRLLARTPYLRDLALLVLSGAVLQALLDWLLSARAAALYAKGPPLLGFFALYNMIVGVASFVAQTGLSRPLLERLGLGKTARLQPLVTAAFAVLALVVPGPASVFALRGAEAVTRNSFFRSAYELFYTPLPAAKKRPTKALVDVGFDRLGTTLGSVALLAVATLAPETATRVVLVGTLLASAAAVVIGSRLQTGYVEALADSLKSGAVALGDDDLVDLTTRSTLAETTALLDRDKLLARIEEFHRERGSHAPSSDGGEPATEALEAAPRSRRASELPLPPIEPSAVLGDALLLRIAALRSSDVARVRAELAAPIPPELAAFVVPLLGRDAVARDAVRALRRAGVTVAGSLVDRLLDPRTETVIRRRLPRVLRAAPGEIAVRGLVRALRDPAFEVRQQAAVALAHATSRTGAESGTGVLALDRAEIFELAREELADRRGSWGPDPARGVGHVFVVLGLVLDREPLSIALRALRGDDAVLRGTAHEYLEVVLPPDVRAALEPLLGTALRAAPPRPPRELAEELLRSHARLPTR